jgi:hypothetical protein
MNTTSKRIEQHFVNILQLTGNVGPAWSGNKARIGAWYLDNARVYGGYQIHEIMNAQGGIRIVGGSGCRMTPKVMEAYLAGMLVGLELKTKVKS